MFWKFFLRRHIKEQTDTVRRYVKSQVEAVNRIHTDKETSVKVLMKYFGGKVDQDILEKSWELLINENFLSKKQYPSSVGFKLILSSLAGKNPKARTAKPEDFVDLRFMKELDQTGYINNFYKR